MAGALGFVGRQLRAAGRRVEVAEDKVLVQIHHRGFVIEAVPTFDPGGSGWKPRARVRKLGGDTGERFVEDAIGAMFLSREHAIQASLFLGRKWADDQRG